VDREVYLAPKEERERVATWCAGKIVRHVRLLNWLSPGAVGDCRLRSYTVGLLYLMRQGISAHGVVVLPR
jgi:hypothetical protein